MLALEILRQPITDRYAPRLESGISGRLGRNKQETLVERWETAIG